MTNRSVKNHVSLTIFLLCAASIVGSFKIIEMSAGGCNACNGDSQLLELVRVLGAVVLYLSACILISMRATRTFGCSIAAICLGAHLILILSMFSKWAQCPYCVASSSLLLVTTMVIAVTKMASPHRIILYLFFGLSVGGLVELNIRAHSPRNVEMSDFDILNVSSLCKDASCKACIIIYERKGCAACNILKDAGHVAQLEQQVGGKICVVRKQANDEMVVPTVVVIGSNGPHVFEGAPTDAQIRVALAPN